MIALHGFASEVRLPTLQLHHLHDIADTSNSKMISEKRMRIGTSIFWLDQFIANWLEGRTIKYTNFPAKYMNSRSKLHWNIHVVLCQISVTWNKRRGIGIPELHDHAERQSAFNTSSKWISLIFYFYDIFLVFFPLMWCLQVYWH